MYPEFPENKDINELEEFDNKSYVYEEDSYTSSQPKFSWLRLLAIILGLALIASLLIPVLGPLMDGFQSNEVSNPEDKMLREQNLYSRWITDNVNDILGNPITANKTRLLGVKFDESVDNPILGILMNFDRSEEPIVEEILKGTSTTIFDTLFDDKRGQNIVILWLKPGKVNSDGQTMTEVVLMIGMLRETAKSIDWNKFDTNKLDQAADIYQLNVPF